MALTKETVVDSIEVTELGCLNIRQVTRILEDGVVISKAYQRHVLSPGDSLQGEDSRVSDIANAVWTQKVIKDYDDFVKEAALKPKESGLVK